MPLLVFSPFYFFYADYFARIVDIGGIYMYFRPVFKFSKEESLSEREKAMLIGEFVKNYNKFCEQSNSGVIDSLNRDWEKEHGSDFNNDEYDKFMIKGQQKVCDRINTGLLAKFNKLEYRMGEEVNFYGILKRDPSITLDMFLKPEE